MKIKAVISFMILFGPGMVWVFPQTISDPNTGIKSPESLEIRKIEMDAQKTVLYITVENRLEGGNFCADKNIFIISPDGSRLKLNSADGIPVCPEAYSFKSIGEKLSFTLTFPPLKPGTEWIDVVEECSSNCFYLYGVTLNYDLNKRLDEAFAIAATSAPEKNLLMFRNLLESVDDKNQGIEGTLYINVITAAIEAGDKVEATVWYKRLLASGAPRLDMYIKFLNGRGIKF